MTDGLADDLRAPIAGSVSASEAAERAPVADAGPSPVVDGTAPGLDATRDGLRTWSAIRDEVAHAVVGAEAALELLVIALLADGHALIEDVPGRRQDAPRPGVLAGPGPDASPGSRARPTCCPAT